MIENEVIQIASSMGVGALLGTLMFFICRNDKKSSEERLTRILEEDQKSRKEHTQALTELTVLLKVMNGHH